MAARPGEPGATLRVEPFRRLTRQERADTREKAAPLAIFLAATAAVLIEL